MRALEWLTARPIAHRGLHDRARGVVENTPGAVARAVEHGFAVEIDVQRSADGAAVVFHDDALERLTDGVGLVEDRTLAELKALTVRDSADRIWTLDDCLDLVGGRQALVVEIKTSRRRDDSFAAYVAQRISARNAPVALKSFDPRVLPAARAAAPDVPRGIIGEAYADKGRHDSQLSSLHRFGARHLLHWPITRPDFVSWHVDDLPRRSVALARAAGRPVMTWTVRTAEDQARAALYADQMVFEGFIPG